MQGKYQPCERSRVAIGRNVDALGQGGFYGHFSLHGWAINWRSLGCMVCRDNLADVIEGPDQLAWNIPTKESINPRRLV
jgi:hypothetical protein